MKTNKTKDCTKKTEKSLKNLLLALEEQFKNHLKAFYSNLDIQKNIIDSIWVISQRFLILTRGAICVRPYPKEQSDREEREMRSDFKIQKDNLTNLNLKLDVSLETLKQKCRTFDRTLANIDTSLPNQTIEGNNERQPIHYYIELFADCLKFFKATQSQLSPLGRFLNVEDIKSIVECKKLLEPDEMVMEYFEKSICEPVNRHL
ncbi:uncharacterized protein LOC129912513 [Episyrphus balteatus]|uniref:uncharacterized protein LOC129912513 n=1 Tax=Episyrphus balteatus TaxID=286459 RepID=UPI00248601D8|nr:uncharacterized protein LOC129912513 [Episyrphus balteatus]